MCHVLTGERLKVLHLCCGDGGSLTRAFKDSGHDIVAGIDNDEHKWQQFSDTYDGRAHNYDITHDFTYLKTV